MRKITWFEIGTTNSEVERPFRMEPPYRDFYDNTENEIQIPMRKTAFSLPSINDNQSVSFIFLTDNNVYQKYLLC